ncbi:MAG TPA: hypothetical protein DCL49_05665 [Candidatus Omnitrophica bacterium]|nr:hypothetical protein [Candidatus Omnitrophota bacterium]HBG62852.1 hypothetical protein [Candidatus Omnitrophota bacterium]
MMTMMKTQCPLISIIVVNYNGKRYLKNCFDSLYKLKYSHYEIIFVDNGSQDDSVKFIRSNFQKAQILKLQSNFGLAIASNRGAKVAKGDYLFFLNNDTLVDENILTELVRVAQSDKGIGVCACNVFTYDGRKEIGMGVACDRFGYPCGNLGPVFYPDAAIFVNRSIFEEVGGFDSKLFLYGEDRDLCWRIWLRGYRVEPVKSAWFLHDSACTLVGEEKYKTNVWKRELGERNLIRSMLKNYSLSGLVCIIPQYLLLSVAEICLLLFVGQFKVVKQAYFRAYLWNLKNLNDTWHEHKKISKLRRIKDIAMWKIMSKKIGKIQVLKWVGIPQFEAKSYKSN